MQRVSRRRLLAASGGAVLAGGVVAQIANAQADKPRRSPWDLTVDAALDPAVAVPAMGTTGPIYLSGDLYHGGALGGDGTIPTGVAPVGALRVWGWIFDPTRPGPSGTVANASFEIRGRGQLLLSGTRVAGRVGILGGTGDFRGANGQAEVIDLGATALRVIFDFTTPYEGT